MNLVASAELVFRVRLINFRILDSLSDFIIRLKKRCREDARNARGQLDEKSFESRPFCFPLIVPSVLLSDRSSTQRLDSSFTCWRETFHSLRLKGSSVARESRSCRLSMQLQAIGTRLFVGRLRAIPRILPNFIPFSLSLSLSLSLFLSLLPFSTARHPPGKCDVQAG